VTHRTTGPAYLEWHRAIKKYTYQAWYKDGKFHRSVLEGQSEGPALEIIYMDYTDQVEEETYKVWFEEGKCTRLNGAAIEGIYNKWYINDVEYEEEDYKKIMKSLNKSCYKFKKPIREKWKQAIYDLSKDGRVSRVAINKDIAGLIAEYL
jgi:hypothetical protein